MTKTFRDLGVDGALCDALAAEGITHPFPIQELTLPLALSGNDLIGQARTGTGKTLAFGLPLLQRLDPGRKVTQALVVVPTRELCLQVHDDLKIGAAKGLRSIAVYGGVGFDEQIEALTSGVHVVVGTPGRLLDHLNRRNLDLSQVTQLVLDEADEMLDMGFLPDVERLVEACTGDDRHTMLFSATMPTEIVRLARRYMDHPTFTRADTEAHETAPNVTQHFLQVHRMDKPRVLARILQSPNRGGVYVFVRTKHMADRLVNELEELGVPSVPVHGDLRQSSREKNLERFRSGKATVLVATEVAARGLDVSGVTHVVNYDCPDDEKMYLHRIGRTARAGEAGVAVTFAEFNEVDKLNVIRKRVGATNVQVEQVFSTSDVLAELFDLPETKPWDHLSGASPSKDRAAHGETSRGRGSSRSGRGSSDASGRSHPDGRSRDGAEAREGAREGRSRIGGSRQGSQRDGGDRATSDQTGRGTGGSRAGDTPETDETRAASRDRHRTGGRRERRPSQSDGRPKSERRTEGTGGEHNASRTRTRDSSDVASDRAPGTETEQRPRSRTRARSRTDQSASGGDTRTGSRSRTGARDRSDAPSRDTGSASQEDGGPADRASDPAETGGERRRARSVRSGQAGGRERSGSGERGGSDGRERGRKSDDRGSKPSSTKGGSEREGDAGGSRRGGEQDSTRSRRGGDRGRSSGGGRGERQRGGEPRRDAEPVELQRRGRGARGEGQPQPARRVKVEHLP